MRALRFPRPLEAEVIEVERPVIRGARELIARVEACGICASDVAAYKGLHPYRTPPVITGHECAGTVVEVGDEVRQVRVGDRVAVEPHLGCGSCRYCRAGEYQQCVKKGLIGVGDWIGGFAEYIVVRDSMCYVIPDDVSWEIAALLEPYNVGVHAVRRAAVGEGESIGIVGTGTIGLATLLALKPLSVGPVVVTDISAAKLEAARKLGADAAYNADEVEVRDEVLRDAPEGLDVVFVTVPKEEAIDLGLTLCTRRGKVILIATLGRPVQIDTHKIQQFERTVIGTAMYNRTDWQMSLRHLQSGDTCSSLQQLISRRVSLDQAAVQIDDLAHGRDGDTIKTMITEFRGER